MEPNFCGTCDPEVGGGISYSSKFLNGDCKGCNSAVYAPCNELNNSDKNIQRQKDEIIVKRLTDIHDTLYLEGSPFVPELLKDPTEAEYHSWLQKLENSSLSLTEKRNLLQNLVSSLSVFNNLSLPLMTKELVFKALGPIQMLEVPDALILETITKYLNNIITNIILKGVYGEETNKYNYSEMFNLHFFYVHENLSLYRYAIPLRISELILKNYI